MTSCPKNRSDFCFIVSNSLKKKNAAVLCLVLSWVLSLVLSCLVVNVCFFVNSSRKWLPNILCGLQLRSFLALYRCDQLPVVPYFEFEFEFFCFIFAGSRNYFQDSNFVSNIGGLKFSGSVV